VRVGAETALPHAAAQDGDAPRAWRGVFRRECTADRGCHAQNSEQFLRARRRQDLFGIAARTGNRDARRAVRGEPCEHMALFFEVEEIWRRYGQPRGGVAPHLGDRDELGGLWIWQRLQHDRVEHAEHHRRRPDAESERRDRDEREQRRP
jgi:hypothetical protein